MLELYCAWLSTFFDIGNPGRRDPPPPGPKDYVDLPDGPRINSSTPRKNPNL